MLGTRADVIWSRYLLCVQAGETGVRDSPFLLGLCQDENVLPIAAFTSKTRIREALAIAVGESALCYREKNRTAHLPSQLWARTPCVLPLPFPVRIADVPLVQVRLISCGTSVGNHNYSIQPSLGVFAGRASAQVRSPLSTAFRQD